MQVWTLPRHFLDTSWTRLSHTPPDDSLTALPLPAAQGEPLYDLFVPINGSVEAWVGQTSAKPRPNLGQASAKPRPSLFTPASGAGRRRGRLDAAAVPACRRGFAAREPAEPARRDARSSRDRAEIGPRSRARRALARLRRRYSRGHVSQPHGEALCSRFTSLRKTLHGHSPTAISRHASRLHCTTPERACLHNAGTRPRARPWWPRRARATCAGRSAPSTSCSRRRTATLGTRFS